MFFAIMVDGNLTIPPCTIHGIDVWIEKDLVEMPHDDRQGRENGFVIVHRRRGIDPPARQQITHPYFGPKHDARHSHEASAPHKRTEEHTSELQSLRHLVCRLLL